MVALMEVNIKPSRNGHLECRDCGIGTHWCEHIEWYVQEGLDQKDIWDETEDGTLSLTGVRLMVPIIPRLSQWADVGFGAEHHGNYKMELLLDSKVDIKTGEVPSEFLGFFSPGEGRMVLRSMVLTWFAPRDVEIKECQATTHDFQAQMSWERDHKKGRERERLAQHWSVFTKGFCLRCAAISDAIGGDDLVPDGGRAGRSPWR